MSGTISSIQVGQLADYASSHLTIDLDWAHDEVLADTVDLVERHRIPATWFVTHETPQLERLRSNPLFEVGIHPNFIFLLQGSDRAGRTAAEVIDRLLAVVPEAKSVRSHSTTQSSVLLELFRERGLTHECNSFIPWQSAMSLRPWALENGLVRVPYFWEDDVAFAERSAHTDIGVLAGRPGLRVFDFHPIHIFLNTEDVSRYERTRPLHRNPAELIEHRWSGRGTRTHFLELLALLAKEGRVGA